MNSSDIFAIPVAYSFSELEHGGESYDLPHYDVDWSEILIEGTILSMLSTLNNDRERVIFLLMAMGGDGYDFKHKDVASMLQIDYSWYMRIVRGIRVQLLPFLEQNSQKKNEKVIKTAKNTRN